MIHLVAFEYYYRIAVDLSYESRLYFSYYA